MVGRFTQRVQRVQRFIACGLLWAVCGIGLTAPEAPPEASGQHCDGFTLSDGRGIAHSLADFDAKQIVVIAFLGTECPLAKLYGPRLEQLWRQYGPRGVAFLAVNSNAHDSPEEIARYAQTHGITFPVLKDQDHRVADQLGASRTPEVFVLDRQRTVRYSGRIDDQYGVGYSRERPGRTDLAAAIDDVLAGREVTTPKTDAIGCIIGRAREHRASGAVTYSNRIATILQNRCVECHRAGDIGPFSLVSYEDAAGWSEMIAEVVRDQRMPPWHARSEEGQFRNDRQLSEDEKVAIARWAADGAPQGEATDLPEPRAFVTGWQLPKDPDAVFTIQKRPFQVQAEGELDYQWFVVDPGFTKDTWVRAVEIVPGNRSVVHHILAFVRTGDATIGIGDGKGYFAGYVPGARADTLPTGMAKLVPAGAKLAFQVHYTPNGSRQIDQSKIGLVFADPGSVTHRVVSSSALSRDVKIPPQVADHREEARSRGIPWDSQLLSMSPHMHFRGKSIRYEAVFPDGRREGLLDVPRFDFNWQTEYRLNKPLALPAGSRIEVVAHFDNSAANPNNPDPSKLVTWGEQSWDEMLIGYFTIALPVDVEIALPESDLRAPSEAAAMNDRRARKIFQRLDANGDAALTVDEVPLAMKVAFSLADKDGNGQVSVEEFAAVASGYLNGSR